MALTNAAQTANTSCSLLARLKAAAISALAANWRLCPMNSCQVASARASLHLAAAHDSAMYQASLCCCCSFAAGCQDRSTDPAPSECFFFNICKYSLPVNALVLAGLHVTDSMGGSIATPTCRTSEGKADSCLQLLGKCPSSVLHCLLPLPPCRLHHPLLPEAISFPSKASFSLLHQLPCSFSSPKNAPICHLASFPITSV